MATKPLLIKRLFSFKWFFRICLVLVLLIALGVLSMPYWQGWLLRTSLPQDIVQLESYERISYGTFRLQGVSITLPGQSIEIDSLESLAPLNWLSHAIRNDASRDFLQIDTVTVTLDEEAASPDNQEETSSSLPQNLPEVLEFVDKILQQTDRWFPRASVDSLRIKRGEQTLQLASIKWNERILTAEGQLDAYPDYPFQLKMLAEASQPNAEFVIPSAEFNLVSELRNEGGSLLIQSIIDFRENRAILQSRFGPEGWAPESASWNLENWNLDLQSFGLDTTYSKLHFNLEGGWMEGTLSNSLAGSLSPRPSGEDPDLPAVDFVSEIGGNAQSLSLSQFSLDAPGVQARMSEPVEYNLQELQLAGNVRFDIDLDLAILNLEGLTGRLGGLLEVSTAQGKPVGTFQLNGQEVSFRDYHFSSLGIHADLNWPRLALHQVQAELDSGSLLAGQGTFDLSNRVVEQASLSGTVKKPTVEAWIPEGVAWQDLAFKTTLMGPLDALQHEGSLDLKDLESAATHPLNLAVQWNGQNLELERYQVSAFADNRRLNLEGTGSLDPENLQWSFTQFAFSAQGRTLELADSPASLLIEPGDPLQIHLQQLNLTGEETRLSLTSQITPLQAGKVDLAAQSFDTQQWISPWLKTPPPPVAINALDLKATWANSPLTLESSWNASFPFQEETIDSQGILSSDGRALTLQAVEISDAGGPWLQVQGRLPITVSLAEASKLTLHRDQPFSLDLQTKENPRWLEWLSPYLPFPLSEFQGQVALNGTLEQLAGNFDLHLQTPPQEGPHGLPSMTLKSRGEIAQSILAIESLSISVLDDIFEAQGSLELPPELITRIEQSDLRIPWETTAFTVKIPSSSLTSLHYFVPQLLNREGKVEAELSGSMSDGIQGFFRIDGLSTRAIFPFGSLRNVTAALEFDRYKASLKDVSAFIGREPVTLDGFLSYEDWKNPQYDFTIAGNNVALVRKPGLLLRSDLDLRIEKESVDPTRISGTVNLKDGLYLLNRNQLFTGSSGGGRSAASRPPYFAVDVPYLADWTLDVGVKGERFIRVKTPAVEAVLSLEMLLQGKLKDPFATGRVNFNEGNLFFPFASFDVQYGAIELPVDNPFMPQLEILGASRRFGYDLTVEITGPANDPRVNFTSNPPLSSEQIMLMVMAGENPEGTFDYSASQKASKLGSYISKGLFASGDSGNSLLNRISVNSGENLSDQGKETMEIEFLLNEDFQVVGEYDEYDFWNAGLRWRIFQRKPTEPGKEEKP